MIWTLDTFRQVLADRLAEVSTAFWSAAERDRYINEAHRIVASVVGGIPRVFTGTVSISSPALSLTSPFPVIAPHRSGVRVVGGPGIPTLDISVVDAIWPGWRNYQTNSFPKWAILDLLRRRVLFAPVPQNPTQVEATVSVLPGNMNVGNDSPFLAHEAFQKYAPAVVTLATALALMKERYEQDAERFYAIYRSQMMDLGINPADVPSNLPQLGGQST